MDMKGGPVLSRALWAWDMDSELVGLVLVLDWSPLRVHCVGRLVLTLLLLSFLPPGCSCH